MKDTIYVTGHKNPDTDSICSSIAYSEFKIQMGMKTIPIRLGELNKETEFVLDHFDLKAPILIKDIKTRVKDIDMDEAITVSENTTIRAAWKLAIEKKVEILAVVDRVGRLKGVVTKSDITQQYMHTVENDLIHKSHASITNVLSVLNGNIIEGTESDFNVTGKVCVGAMTPDEMIKHIGKGDIVITGDREDNQIASIKAGAKCLIITGNSKVGNSTITLAKKNNTILISTPKTTYTAVRAINQAVPLSYVMTSENILQFNSDDTIDKIKAHMASTRFRAYPVVNDQGKILGFISRYHLISKHKRELILVDHNEKSQSIDGIEDALVIEIVDHHRIGDIQTTYPIRFINEPVGCTSTIIAELYMDNNIPIKKKIAGIMLAAILSDTLKFKSPTCTPKDIRIAKQLAKMSEVDIDSFSLEMFKAGSDIADKEANEIFHQDFKEYEIAKYKLGVGQITTLDIEAIKPKIEDIYQYMEKECERKSYSFVVLAITNILDGGSQIIFAGDESNIVRTTFNIHENERFKYIDGIISRKKQMIPMLSKVIEE